MSVRIFALAAAFSAGTLIAEWLTPSPVMAFGMGVAAAVTLLAAASRRASGLVAVAALMLLGVSLAGSRIASLERGALATAARRGADASITGHLVADPTIDPDRIRLTLAAERALIRTVSVTTRERLVVYVRPIPNVSMKLGDRVRVDARLAPPLSGSIKAAHAAATRLRWAGISVRAYARPDGLVRLGGPERWLDRVGALGRSAVERPVSRLPHREAGLLLGITIGDTSGLDPVMETDFRTTGLTHLLAVSGANLALFLGSIAFALRALRVRRRAIVAVLGLSTIAFAAITRFEPSVLRAGLMAGVALAGLAIGARRETLTALAVAALIIQVVDPFIIHSIGFQLSALATLGILVLGPPLNAAFQKETGSGRLREAAAVTIAAQIAVAPLIALTFHSLSIISLVANLVAVPAVGPATVLGIVAAPLGALWSPLGVACVTLTRPFIWWMSGSAAWFARVPHASIGTPSGVAGAFVFVGLLVLAVASRKVRRAPRSASVLGVALLMIATSVWSGALMPDAVRNALQITAIDVGQGDAILVRAPGGATMLIDGGPDPARILRALALRRIDKIDLLVLTHPHADHVIGLAAVAKGLRIERGLDAGLDADLPAYAEYLGAIQTKHIPRLIARAGMRLRLGPAILDVLNPIEPLMNGTDSDLNNNSVVIRATFGAGAALLAGEVQVEGQARLLEQPDGLRSDVFKVPHHGSPKFLTTFYEATHAKVALIPVGRNDYGHPAPTCLEALAAGGMRIVRTDRNGDSTVYLDATGRITVSEARRAA